MPIFCSINSLMRIYQCFGLAPFAFNQKTRKWQSSSLFIRISLAIVFYNATIFCGTLIFNETFINYKNANFRVYLLALMLSWTHVHAICAVLELLLKRRKQIELLNILEMLDTLYSQHLNIKVDFLKLNRMNRRIVFLWICEVLAFVITDLFYYTQTKNKRIIAYVLCYTPSFAICRLSYAYSIILVSLINEYIVVLNIYLKSITKRNGYYIRETFIHELKRKTINHRKSGGVGVELESILFMKHAYSKLWGGCVTINYQIHCSMVIGLSNDFLILIFNSYWMFLTLILRSEPYSVFTIQLSWIISVLANMIFVSHYYRKIVRTVGYSRIFPTVRLCWLYSSSLFAIYLLLGVFTSIEHTPHSFECFRFEAYEDCT